MSDWQDDLAKVTKILFETTKIAGSIAVLTKLIEKLKKARLKNSDAERDEWIDALRNASEETTKILTRYAELLAKHTEVLKGMRDILVGLTRFSSEKVAPALVNVGKLAKIVIFHETRLKALEASLEAKKKKTSRKRTTGQ